jgi:ParB-like chromosome segregation protein Spo0J
MKKVNMIERTEEKKVAERLDQLARKAGDEVDTFNIHQKVVDKVKGLSGFVVNAKEVSEKRKYSTELANALNNGTAKSKALGSEIVDVLQGRLPRTKAAIPRVQNPRPSVPTALQTAEAEVDLTEASEHIHSVVDRTCGQGDLFSPGACEESTDGSTTNNDDGLRSVIVPVKVSDLIRADPFKSLFPISPEIVAAIAADMRTNGFDSASPLTVWKERMIVVDGNTRIEGAIEAGIVEVPVFFRSFADENEALAYAVHVQRYRRNLTDDEILHLVEVFDKRGQHGGDRKSAKSQSKNDSGPSSAQTARQIGSSPTKVEKARAIIDSKDEELKAEVKSGKISINQGAAKARAAKRAPKPDDENKARHKTGVKVQKLINQAVDLLTAHGDAYGSLPADIRKKGEEIVAMY